MQETPFAFYAWLLGGDGGRQRILRRLGHEANDALDEFLELALNYERKAPASLQGFMAWLRSADTEVKRDMEISRDEVRVMTVHGAKGLEASVVFMVDTTSSPSDTQRLRLINVPRGNGGEVVVWAGRKADDPKAVADARKAMLEDTEDEYRRLLYVAMTRAADRLIVARLHARQHEQRAQAVLVRSDRQGAAGFGIAGRDDRDAGRADQALHAPRGSRRSRPARPRPRPRANGASCRIGYARRYRAKPPGDHFLRPSDAAGNAPQKLRSGESVEQRTRALQRGTLVHRLLQSLPDLAAGAAARGGGEVSRAQCHRLERGRAADACRQACWR